MTATLSTIDTALYDALALGQHTGTPTSLAPFALVGRFAGRTGTAAELTADGSMHEAKEAFLTAAKARATEELAEQVRAAAAKPGTPAPPPGQRVKLQADAILDGLIRRLAPR